MASVALSAMFPRQTDNRSEEDIQADPCQSSSNRSTGYSSKRTPLADPAANEEPEAANDGGDTQVRKKQRLDGKRRASTSSPACNTGGSEPLQPVTSLDQASLGASISTTSGINSTLLQLLGQLQQSPQQQQQANASAVRGQYVSAPPAAAMSQPTQLHPPALSFVAHQEQLALAKLQLDMQKAQQGRSAADPSTLLQGQIQPDRAQPQQTSISQQLLLNPQVLQTLLANFAHIFGVPTAAPPPAPPAVPIPQTQSFQQPVMPVMHPALNLASLLQQPAYAATGAANGSASHPLLAAVAAAGLPPRTTQISAPPVSVPAPLSSLLQSSVSSATSPAGTTTTTASPTVGVEGESSHRSHPPPTTLSRPPPVNLTSEGKSVLLFVPKDESILSTYQCMVRKQIELFEATDDDVQFTISKMSKPVVLGQVGIRCRHCAVLPQYARPKAAVYFPRSLDSMYQFGQNMVKNHLAVPCKKIPTETQQRLIELQEERKRGRGGRERWAEGARELGVIETENGLRFIK